MPKRKRKPSQLSTPDHRAIVNAQQELLRWCPNVEGASKNEMACEARPLFAACGIADDDVSREHLEYVCWACGASGTEKLTRCHIDQYQPNEACRPENFILLCDRCHKDQPDALPKEVIKYWLSTREPEAKYNARMKALFDAAMELLKRDFGCFLVEVACGELACDISRLMETYVQKSAGQNSRNMRANLQWGWLAEVHNWCVANRERVGMDMPDLGKGHSSEDGHETARQHSTGKRCNLAAANKTNGEKPTDLFMQQVRAVVEETRRCWPKVATKRAMRKYQDTEGRLMGHPRSAPTECVSIPTGRGTRQATPPSLCRAQRSK
jgi:5-methylcytosine-specific restriction endonuclease McrA